MKLLLFIALLPLCFWSQVAFAQQSTETEKQVAPEIIEIRKSLPMEPTEKSVKDFIINRGSSAGLKAGAYVNVVREVAVNDPVRNKALGALHIPVGKIQIIHVESNISVARLYSELRDDERPMLDYEALMIGDEVDLASISMDTPKASKNKWRTAAATAITETVTEVAKQQAPAEQPSEQSSVQPDQVQQATELASVAPQQAPENPQQPTEPAFIITPIENDSEAPVKEKTSFIPNESATVTATTAAN